MTDQPFAAPGRFYRGNLHTHSDRSDGLKSPEEVVQAYRQAGYHFIAMTDHFEARYDWPVTDTSHLDDGDFISIPGAELHAPANSMGDLWHIVAVGLPPDFAATGPDETGSQLAARAAAAGAFIGIAHPACSGLSLEDVEALPDAHAVEIYNHLGAVYIDRGDGWYLAEAALSCGRRLTAYAADDAHFKPGDHFGGWVEVKAESLDRSAILEALKNGRFYSTQGPRILDLQIGAAFVDIACTPAQRAVALGRGTKAAHAHGQALTQFRLPLERFGDGYVRLVIIDADGKKAWTNPIWLG